MTEGRTDSVASCAFSFPLLATWGSVTCCPPSLADTEDEVSSVGLVTA